jgi:ketosteroid isomerase-like protein
LDAFVSDYAKDSLTGFVSRGHVHQGYAWIRRNYAPRFAEGAERDSLPFEEFAVRPLAPAVALVTARFVLFRDGRDMASGPFTLIMERRADGWKILHDHTSSD